MNGEDIGRYKLAGEPGDDGICQLYSATDAELGRQVLIKIAKQEALNSWVLNAARHLAALPHPEILPVYDVGFHSGLAYFVTENLVRSLSSELEASSGSLVRDSIVEIVRKISIALDYVHRRGVIHRNIKPFSISLDRSGQPRLSGFEISLGQEGRMEREGTTVGTPSYMAPEQIRNDPLGPYTDVWGLGVTLYELLTRRKPFGESNDPSDDSLFRRILNDEPEPLRNIEASIPPELERICLKCLSKAPSARYQGCHELATDLSAYQPRPERPKNRVFVSHSSADREFVENQVVSLLESNDVKTWYSKADIHTAAEWEQAIRRGLQSCNWFLIVVSRNSIKSDWVKDELFWAIDNRPENIIPLRIDDCDERELHIRLARKQFVDFRIDLKRGRIFLLNLVAPPSDK